MAFGVYFGKPAVVEKARTSIVFGGADKSATVVEDFLSAPSSTGGSKATTDAQQKMAFGVKVEEHPVDFRLYENAYSAVPIIQGAIDARVDYLCSPGYYLTGNPNAVAVIEKWMEDVNFNTILPQIARTALTFGFAPVEKVWTTGFDATTMAATKCLAKLTLLDPKNIYVQYGEVQTAAGTRRVPVIQKFIQLDNGKAVAEWLPEEIACFYHAEMGMQPYGTSMLRAVFGSKLNSPLFNYLSVQQSLRTILQRKANAPIVATLGDENNQPTQADANAMQAKLEQLSDKSEWVVDYRIKLDALGFEGKLVPLVAPAEYYESVLIYALEVPHVLLGRANVPEGLATAQQERLNRTIQADQAQIEKTIEQDIFDAILVNAGLPEEHVEFCWGQESAEDTTAEVQRLTTLLQNNITPAPDELKLAMFKKLNELLELGVDASLITLPSAPGVVPPVTPYDFLTQPYTTTQDANWLTKAYEALDADVLEFYEQGEIVPAEYEWYSVKEDVAKAVPTSLIKQHIAQAVKTVGSEGMDDWRKKDITRLQKVIRQGIEKNASIPKIAKKILPLVDGDKNAADLVARTEVSRVENNAAVRAYVQSGVVEKAQFLTAEDERVCKICGPMNGKEYSLEEALLTLPRHPRCRCTWTPIVAGA